MLGFDKQKNIRNLVTLAKFLILDDDFLELSLPRKIFSQRMLNDIMRNDSPSLDCCMKLVRRGQDAFTQFIGLSIETKQSEYYGFAFEHYLKIRLR